jgi:hypothetical protein
VWREVVRIERECIRRVGRGKNNDPNDSGGVKMENTTCCEKLVTELDLWKGKADYIARELDNIACQDNGKMFRKTMDLHMLVEELEDRIDTLKSNCPEGWEPDEIGVIMLRIHTTGNWGKDWEYCGPWLPR